MSLRDRRATTDLPKRRDTIYNEIKDDYQKNGKHQVVQAEQINVMLIGRTRTGKSTIKMLLVDPTKVPSVLTLKSDTRDPVFESFYMNDKKVVLNIIDTPGLFEHSSTEVDVRDNETILRTIELCANRELTKFHVICFCVAITTGINKEDISSLKLLADFLGNDISRNSCLIVTRCESKNKDQREQICKELLEDIYFKEIADFFKLGIFFSGSLNPDDYEQGNDSLYEQYFTVCDYRSTLIDLFTKNIDPFLVKDTLISDVRQAQKDLLIKSQQLEKTETRNKELENIIEEMKAAQNNNQRAMPELIDRLQAINVVGANEQPRRPSGCIIS